MCSHKFAVCVLRAIEAASNASENAKLVFHEFRNLVPSGILASLFHVVFIPLDACIFFASPPSLTNETILFYENIRVHSTFNPHKCLFSLCIVALKMMAQSAWNPLNIQTRRRTHSSHSIADWRWDQIKKQPLKRGKKVFCCESECKWCVQRLNCGLFFMIHSHYISHAFGYVSY